MTAPAKLRRSWRFYFVRTFATIFVVAGWVAINILSESIPREDIGGMILRATVQVFATSGGLWTSAKIWDVEFGSRVRD